MTKVRSPFLKESMQKEKKKEGVEARGKGPD